MNSPIMNKQNEWFTINLIMKNILTETDKLGGKMWWVHGKFENGDYIAHTSL